MGSGSPQEVAEAIVAANVKAALEKERARVHVEKLAVWARLNRDYPIPEFLQSFITPVLVDVAEDSKQDRRVNIGVLGNAGVGKSSLIGAVMTIAQSNMDAENHPKPVTSFQGDGTRKPTPYELGGFGANVRIWDLPGQGTTLFPAKTYLCKMGLKYFDAVLIVSPDRWTENDRALHQAIKFADIWCNIVRTKVDLAVDDGRRDHKLTQEQSLERVLATLMEDIPESDASKLHLVTTREEHWIGVNGLGFGKIDALVQSVKAHIDELLEKHRLPSKQPKDETVSVASSAIGRFAPQPRTDEDADVRVVVSSPEFGPDNVGGFSFEVMERLKKWEHLGSIHIGYDWKDSPNSFDDDLPKWKEWRKAVDQGLQPEHRNPIVYSTRWFDRYVGGVKGSVRGLRRAVDGRIVVVTIAGGPITQAEQARMPAIIGEIKQELLAGYVQIGNASSQVQIHMEHWSSYEEFAKFLESRSPGSMNAVENNISQAKLFQGQRR